MLQLKLGCFASSMFLDIDLDVQFIEAHHTVEATSPVGCPLTSAWKEYQGWNDKLCMEPFHTSSGEAFHTSVPTQK
ncbi:hypothetical protein CEXT_805381 [Caerostris extrusa]|uniref:Uncharacterized protein n=1 Tax=Caerostris extrusa TaxID=172846 RepID=A0AAV4W3Q6_CAEEX|nr:hypothetical protein CEXT_805381 [Caerostris extrusa]